MYRTASGLFRPVLRRGLRWTIEGAHLIPRVGPVILASNHVSYLDPLVLAYVADRADRRVRFLAKAELFDKPGLGWLLRAAHQIPVSRGTSQASRALDAAVGAARSGACVAVFPEGTISTDLDPMPGKSGTARLARASGAVVVPVGLWGSHRILTKHRDPSWQWGVPQVAVVGSAVRIGADESVRVATDQIMSAICAAVGRARELYPATASERDEWWWREPSSARLRSCRPRERSDGRPTEVAS